jgi:hypothetical protein
LRLEPNSNAWFTWVGHRVILGVCSCKNAPQRSPPDGPGYAFHIFPQHADERKVVSGPISSVPSMPRVLVGTIGLREVLLPRSLSERGYATYGADAIPGLAAWHDDAGRTVPASGTLDRDFLTTHRYLWDQRVMSAWLRTHPTAVLFGISHNSADHTAMFDLVALIEAPADEILRNLADNSRANAFGHEADHLRMARSDTVNYYRRAPARWLRLPERDPDQLIAHLQRASGASLRLSSAESP